MNEKIKIGPIKRRPTASACLTSTVRKQVNKMKLGEFFEVSGLDKNAVNNLRASLSNYAKKDSFRVKTAYSGNTLTIDRIRK